MIICGPTATGKTLLALKLAGEINGEVISADSRQVYKNLNALTGKDLPEKCQVSDAACQVKYKGINYKLQPFILNGIPVWMYDVVNFSDGFSVAHFQYIARQLMADIWKRNKIPVITGGTGLYLRALTEELSLVQIPPDPVLRESLNDKSVAELQEELKKYDLRKWQTMNHSDRANPRRLVRAIEIRQARTALPVDTALAADTLWIGLTAKADLLKRKIENKINLRWPEASEEVRSLTDEQLGTPGLNTVFGLVPIREYLKSKLTKEEALKFWTNLEFNYAKRQLTWFKKEPQINWFDITKSDFSIAVKGLVQTWYTRLQ